MNEDRTSIEITSGRAGSNDLAKPSRSAFAPADETYNECDERVGDWPDNHLAMRWSECAQEVFVADNNAPSVDSLSATEDETDDSDAEFDIGWSVSDSDGNLDTVDLTLYDDTDGETEDSASIGVSGDSASGTTRLVAQGDDGSGHSYTVEAVVTDTDGASDTGTTSVDESEDTSDNTSPTVQSLSLTEDESGGSPHADFDAHWDVDDDDGNLDTVSLTLYELDSSGNRVETEDSASVDVSGSDATGTTDLTAKHDENNGKTYEVELVVTDSAGAESSDTARETEDGMSDN